MKLTKSDIKNCITAMKLAYKSQFVYTDEEVPQLAELWYSNFKDYPREVVMAAMNEAMQECEYIPTLSQLCKRIKATTQVFSLTPIDLWNEVEGNLKYLYNADRKRLEEVFDGLNPATKRYFGNMPYKYLELYNMPSEQYGFEKARFLKSVQPFIDQQETADKVGAGDFFNQLTSETVKKIGGGNNG